MPRTRAAASCSRCRSRKQKCDEVKPTCSRCRKINEPCVWPATHKRGPAKGYTEALEHRLAETENVLLQLLSVVDNEIIDQALDADQLPPRPLWTSNDIEMAPSVTSEGSLPGPNKAGLMAHWDGFPLDTAHNIRRWAEKKVGKYVNAAMTKYTATNGQALASLDSSERVINTEQLSLHSARTNRELDRNIASDNSGHEGILASNTPTVPDGNGSPHMIGSVEAMLEPAHGTTSFPEYQSLVVGQDLPNTRGLDVTCNQGKRKIDISWSFRQQFLW
ncbi:hypothetical protein F4810DRAFT_513177 [Camillea tinctor]|nr:hypothetical protein F4810DRAFT_513177 [Camillea tinctor]